MEMSRDTQKKSYRSYKAVGKEEKTSSTGKEGETSYKEEVITIYRKQGRPSPNLNEKTSFKIGEEKVTSQRIYGTTNTSGKEKIRAKFEPYAEELVYSERKVSGKRDKSRASSKKDENERSSSIKEETISISKGKDDKKGFKESYTKVEKIIETKPKKYQGQEKNLVMEIDLEEEAFRNVDDQSYGYGAKSDAMSKAFNTKQQKGKIISENSGIFYPFSFSLR